MIVAFEKSVGAVIFRKEGDKVLFLLLHYHSGHWDYPKGHVEDAETDEQTLRREVEEETGITDIEIIPGFKKEIRYFYRAKGDEKEKRKESKRGLNIMKKVIFYLAETKTKDVKTTEHVGFEWLNRESALKRITYKKSREVFEPRRPARPWPVAQTARQG